MPTSRSLEDGTIGEPVSALVSRHISRSLGKKISGRVKLSPAAMESTHDIDFVLWCLAPRKPIRIYAQEAAKIMKAQYNAPDCVWMIITMDDGTVVTIGGGWVLPPAYPNFSSTWIEFIGTEGAVMVDDTHRDVYVTNMQDGIRFPMSSMPGEKVNHVYAGPMEPRRCTSRSAWTPAAAAGDGPSTRGCDAVTRRRRTVEPNGGETGSRLSPRARRRVARPVACEQWLPPSAEIFGSRKPHDFRGSRKPQDSGGSREHNGRFSPSVGSGGAGGVAPRSQRSACKSSTMPRGCVADDAPGRLCLPR